MKPLLISILCISFVIGLLFFSSWFHFRTNIIKVEVGVVKTIRAYITSYSKDDSCHYEGCKNASGKVPTKGSIACPRFLKLGSMVRINKKEYTCDDRYALWVDQIRKYPTFDVWTEEGSAVALEMGRTIMNVEVLALK